MARSESSPGRSAGRLGYLAGCAAAALVLACLLAPPVFHYLRDTYTGFRYPYSRVFDRTVLALFVVVLLANYRVFSGAWWRGLLVPAAGERRVPSIARGCLVSLVLGLIALPFYVDGVMLVWDTVTLGKLAAKLPMYLLTAAVVSVLEEVVFRGVLLRTLSERWGTVLSILVVSLFYAAVHFIAPDKSFVIGDADMWEGFRYFGEVLNRIMLPGTAGGVFGLFIAGVVLAVISRATGSLYTGIGVHAGWIMLMKLSLLLTTEGPAANFPPGVGRRYFLVSEPVGWMAIALVLPFVLTLLRTSRGDRT